MERQACGPAQQPLERRATDLVTALHVARRRHDVRAAARQLHHRVDDVRLVGAVRHGDQHVVAGRRWNFRLHRVEHAPPEIVAQAADRRQLRVEAVDDRDRRVFVEVVHDEDLVRRRDPGIQRAQDGLDRLPLLEHGDDDRELGRGAPLPARPGSRG